MTDGAFAPPHNDDAAQIDIDAEPPKPTVLLYLAAASSGVAAMAGLALSLQMVLIFTWLSGSHIFAVLMLLLNAVWLVSAAMLSRGTGWASIVCTAMAVLATVIAPIWMVWVMMSGAITLLSMIWGLPCLLAAVLAPFSIGTATQISAHRRALYR